MAPLTSRWAGSRPFLDTHTLSLAARALDRINADRRVKGLSDVTMTQYVREQVQLAAHRQLTEAASQAA